MNRLMLLAGQTRREGWKTLDSKGSVDYLATIPPLPDAVKAVKWDEIELIHGINVLYPWETETLLREIREVLKPEGLLILEQPELSKVLEAGRVEWLFGDPQPCDPAHMAKWCYGYPDLRARVLNAGFRYAVLRPAKHHWTDRDFRIEARP